MIMYAPVYDPVPERFVDKLGYLIVNRRIRSHFPTPLIACPIFRSEQKLPTYPLAPVVLNYIPALDKAYRMRGVAAICAGTQADLKKAN
jgi:hypothetical protein